MQLYEKINIVAYATNRYTFLYLFREMTFYEKKNTI